MYICIHNTAWLLYILTEIYSFVWLTSIMLFKDTFFIILKDFLIVTTKVSITRIVSIDAHHSMLILRHTKRSTLPICRHFIHTDLLKRQSSQSKCSFINEPRSFFLGDLLWQFNWYYSFWNTAANFVLLTSRFLKQRQCFIVLKLWRSRTDCEIRKTFFLIYWYVSWCVGKSKTSATTCFRWAKGVQIRYFWSRIMSLLRIQLDSLRKYNIDVQL